MKQQPVKNPRITCDDCGEVFKLKMKNIKKEKVVEEVERSYFNCPKCKHKYIFLYEDQEFKDNIKEMSDLRTRMSHLDVNSDEAKEIMSKYESLHKKNIEISNKYKGVYGS